MEAPPSYTETCTITFGDQAENHVGMQKLGEMAPTGFTVEDLRVASELFEGLGAQTQLICLNDMLSPDVRNSVPNAYVLVVKDGLRCIVNPDEFHAEQHKLEKDTKALMYGRVVNKAARHNLCFGDAPQEPDYVHGKGRIVAFDQTPLLDKVRGYLPEIFGSKAAGLVAEGNYYYDINKCGIGFHGDAERRIVVAIRTGCTLPLRYRWYFKGKQVSGNLDIDLSHGDIYAMSEKATGNDWKKRNIYTLRHAAGSAKYIA